MSTASQPASGQFNASRPQPEGNFDGDPSQGMAVFGQEVRSQLQATNDQVAELNGQIEVVQTQFSEWQQSQADRFEQLMEGGRFAEVAEQLQALETQVTRLGQFGPGTPRQQVSRFHAHVASEGFRAWVDAQAPREKDSGRTKIPHLLEFGGPYSGRQSGQFAVDIDDSLVGVLDPSVRRPGVIELLRDPIGLMDVINIIPAISSRNYDYFRETAESETAGVGTLLAADIDGDPTPKTTCTVEESYGFIPGQPVIFYNTSATPSTQSRDLVSKDDATGVLTFAANDLDFDAPTGSRVTTEHFLATAEAAQKPAGYLEAEEVNETLQTIATWVRSTYQRLIYSSVTNLTAWIERRLPQRWRESMEWHCLYGSGSNQQLKGFLNAAVLPATNTDTWSTDLSTGDTRADLILYAACQIPGDVRTVAVLNRKDWFRINNYKAGDGHYVQNLAEGPRIIDTPGLKAIGSVQVVLSRMVTETTGLVFAPDFASELVPGLLSEMWTGFVGDDRIKNKVTHLYESDAVHAIMDDRAFRKVDFDGPPA